MEKEWTFRVELSDALAKRAARRFWWRTTGRRFLIPYLWFGPALLIFHATGARPELLIILWTLVGYKAALVQNIVRFIICAVVGWYFMARGGLMFRVVSRQNPLCEQGKPGEKPEPVAAGDA